MNLNDKPLITIVLAIALLTGFLSIAYIQNVHAQVPGLDLSGIPGLNFLKGPKGDKGDTGAQGPVGPKGDTGAQGLKGDTGATGSPCPHQSKLASITGDGRASVIVLNPTPGENPDMVCVP